MSYKKAPDLRKGPGCSRWRLDFHKGMEVSWLCEDQMEKTITHSYRTCTTPFHLVIRRSFQAVGVSAYQITAIPTHLLLTGLLSQKSTIALLGGVLADCRGPVKRGLGCAISTIA
jgi:hypothetical protein